MTTPIVGDSRMVCRWWIASAPIAMSAILVVAAADAGDDTSTTNTPLRLPRRARVRRTDRAAGARAPRRILRDRPRARDRVSNGDCDDEAPRGGLAQPGPADRLLPCRRFPHHVGKRGAGQCGAVALSDHSWPRWLRPRPARTSHAILADRNARPGLPRRGAEYPHRRSGGDGIGVRRRRIVGLRVRADTRRVAGRLVQDSGRFLTLPRQGCGPRRDSAAR